MDPDLLDLLLVVAAVLFAISGYRQGFVVGILSFVGFLGGGILGAKVAPSIARSDALDGLPEPVVGLVIVFLGACVGQLFATLAGNAVRRRMTFQPARQVDAVAGAGISVVGLLLVAWLVGTAVVSSPFPALASQVKRSVILSTVDSLVPGEGKAFFASFRRLIDDRGFPQVFDDFARPRIAQVPPPDPALARSSAVRMARDRVYKITGLAPSCSRSVEGTGFVYAPERVMTNAHVVAGVNEPKVEVGGRKLDATVVLFNPQRDIAVLRVPGLRMTPLRFDGTAEQGAGAVVVGYPENGPFTATAARVRAKQDARGPDIYQSRTVVREIYAVRSRVRPGNSGGPLLAPDGRVYGVIFAAAADDPSTGYALTADEVSPDAQRARTATRRVSTQTCD